MCAAAVVRLRRFLTTGLASEFACRHVVPTNATQLTLRQSSFLRPSADAQRGERDAGLSSHHDPQPEALHWRPANSNETSGGIPIHPQRARPQNQAVRGKSNQRVHPAPTTNACAPSCGSLRNVGASRRHGTPAFREQTAKHRSVGRTCRKVVIRFLHLMLKLRASILHVSGGLLRL
ncbi:peptide hydrolase [Trypanosoma cruzi]|nr:peptide hydrolase [Trypanosoma cruzi]